MPNVINELQNDFWSALWVRRRAGAIGLGIGVLVAVMLCFVLPPKWQARMTVGPAGRGAGADLSAFLPASESPTIQYLLQRVGSVTAADFSVYETLMTSPRIAAALQKDDAFKDGLADLCDDCTTDASALSRWLECHVRIRPLGATQMRRVILRMNDRDMAADLLRALHRLTDETIRADARIRTDQRIQYLRAQMAVVNNPDHRDALVDLLKDQERTRMMVGIDHDFAAEAIDPPSLSSRPVFPNPYIFLPVFALLGLAAGLIAGLVRKS
jgi:hypothetical protein